MKGTRGDQNPPFGGGRILVENFVDEDGITSFNAPKGLENPCFFHPQEVERPIVDIVENCFLASIPIDPQGKTAFLACQIRQITCMTGAIELTDTAFPLDFWLFHFLCGYFSHVFHSV
jgi:hypothetical protein